MSWMSVLVDENVLDPLSIRRVRYGGVCTGIDRVVKDGRDEVDGMDGLGGGAGALKRWTRLGGTGASVHLTG